MNEVDRKEIKSFEQLRARVRRLVEQHEGPLPPNVFGMVREFLPEDDLSGKQPTGGEENERK